MDGTIYWINQYPLDNSIGFKGPVVQNLTKLIILIVISFPLKAHFSQD